jgi:hypothetical protein
MRSKPKPLPSPLSERYLGAMRLDAAWARLRFTAATAVVVSALASCADASGRFQQFEDRRGAPGNVAAAGGALGMSGAPADGGTDGGCRPPAPGVVHGPALLALHTSTTSSAAILFFGELETPVLGGATAVKYSYKALDASDRRSLVGDPLVVGPYAIADDGTFDAETDESTLPGEADAILPGVEITSQLTLHGTICGVSDFYCGTVTGTVTAPIMQDATGEFGLLLVNSIDDIPTQPRFGCAEDALAPALK